MTSRPSASTRRVTSEPVSKPPCTIHALAVVADKVQLTGTHPIEIGESTILHPYARIKAEGGKITIGANCTVNEEAVVGFTGPRSVEGSEGISIVIGDGVNIDARAIVEARSIGDGTNIEAGSRIGRGAQIGKHCKITPLSVIQPGEELPDYTVVFGHNQRRLDTTTANHPEVRQAKHKGQIMQIELLKTVIPNASEKWR